MSYVSYSDGNGNGCRLIPAPFVGVQKNYIKTGDGKSVGTTFTLTIVGTVVAWMGSPRSKIHPITGVVGTVGVGGWSGPNDYFWTGSDYPSDEVDVQGDDTHRLSAMLRKQEAIRDLFSVDGRSLEFQAFDGGPAMKCNPRILNITFQEDVWYQTFRYTITCECDILYATGLLNGEDSELNDYISNAEESWQFEVDNDLPENAQTAQTYRLTHTLSAVGQRVYNPDGTLKDEPWQQARRYVVSKLGLDNNILSSGVNNLPSYYGGYNHFINEVNDIKGGGYSATETWILSSGSAIENFTVTTTNPPDAAISLVRIEGEIRGLQNAYSKHHNADVKWGQVSSLLNARASLYTGLSLNSTPVAYTKGVNPVEGVITYSYEYDNGASKIIPGVKSEVISVTHSLNVDAFAEIFVLGRASGPVLQNLGTIQAKTVDIAIEIVLANPIGLSSTSLNDMKNYFTYAKPSVDPTYAPYINSILEANKPSNYGYTTQFVHVNNETWEPRTGRYSLQYGWTYE